MGDDRERGSRGLRFAITGALLVTPMAGCGEDDPDAEPAREPAGNEVLDPGTGTTALPEPTTNVGPAPRATPDTPGDRNE